MSVYDEMRAILALDLKPTELKVWMTYRLEMDEDAREVRGKSQAELREVAGISESQFSTASGTLQKRGLISVQRFPNAAQIISVPVPNAVPNSEGSEIRNPREMESGTPGIWNPEPLESRGSSLYTAPSTALSTAPRDDVRERDMPPHVKPIENWSTAFARSQDNHGVEAIDGQIILINGTRQMWLERFDEDAEALDLALIEAAGEIQPNRSHGLKIQVERLLAQKVRDRKDRDRRYAAAVKANARPTASPHKPKRTLADVLAERANA